MAGPTVPQTLSRRRPPPTGDEETTAILKLGEYEGTACLSVSEANVLLRRVIDIRTKVDEDGQKPPPPPNTDVFIKTRDYLEIFARFRSDQAAQQVEGVSQKLVNDGSITMFERAQLATLCCETVDEARTLVPSLEGKVSDEDLLQVLKDITVLRDFS